MSIVIVTNNQYLIAAKIHHVTMNENYEYHDIRNSNGRYASVREDTCDITIIYTPDTLTSNNSNSSRDEFKECTVRMRNRKYAYEVYKDLIKQIREQLPDQLFLDKALENLLTNTNFEILIKEDYKSKPLEFSNDRKPKKVRRARKTKRRSQKVLRKPKKRR